MRRHTGEDDVCEATLGRMMCRQLRGEADVWEGGLGKLMCEKVG